MPQTAVKQSMLLKLVLLSMLTCLAHSYTPSSLKISPDVKRAAFLAASEREGFFDQETPTATPKTPPVTPPTTPPTTPQNATQNATQNETQNATSETPHGWQWPSAATIFARIGGAASNIPGAVYDVGATVVSCGINMWKKVPPVLPEAVLNQMMCTQCTDWRLPGCQFTAPGYKWSVCDEAKNVKYSVDDPNLFMMGCQIWFNCFVCSLLSKFMESYIKSKFQWPDKLCLILRCYIALNFCKVPWTVYAVWQRQKAIQDIAWTLFDSISTFVLNSLTGGTYTAMGVTILKSVLCQCTEQLKNIQKIKWLACVEGGLACFEYGLCFLEINPLQEAVIEWLIPTLKNQHATKQPKKASSDRKARGRSPGRKNDSEQQFQFRVECVRDKDGTDISQKKQHNGELHLEHKKYGESSNCYLQCCIMTENEEEAGKAFPYNEIRSSWTRPEYIEATALQGFEFRYDVSTSLLDMKMPQDKKSFQGALRALGHQNGLHMKWLDQ